MLRVDKPKGTKVTVKNTRNGETTPAVVTDDNGTVREDTGGNHRACFAKGLYEVVEDD